MYKKIKYFFTNNIPLKALSILISICLWFVVMNINNPTEIKTFSLGISILNEEKLEENKIAILNIDELKNQKTEIKIKGSRSTLDEISKKYNKENLKLSLDLEKNLPYNIGDEPLDIKVNLIPSIPALTYPNNSFEIVSFYPTNVTVYLDKIITIPKRIHPKIIGNVSEGYISYDPELSSEYVQVTGPKSLIDDIQVIYAEINVENSTSTLVEKSKLVAYNKDGNMVEGIKFNIDEVSITVPINLQGVINIETPKLVGELPEGYIVDSVYLKPNNVEVIGDSNNLKNITKISLPEIDITNLTSSEKYIYDISQILNKYNLKLKNNNDKNIEVYVNIKKATVTQVSIPIDKVNIVGYNDDYIVDIPSEIVVDIVDEKNILKDIDINNLNYSIDITGLEEGRHSVIVNLQLPEGIKVISEPYINVVISSKNNDINEESSQISEENESSESFTTTETTT